MCVNSVLVRPNIKRMSFDRQSPERATVSEAAREKVSERVVFLSAIRIYMLKKHIRHRRESNLRSPPPNSLHPSTPASGTQASA